MATKKTTKKSESVKAPTQNNIEEVKNEPVMDVETSVEVVKEVEQEKKPVRKHAKVDNHDPTELIACRSMIYGHLYLDGPKTAMNYSWSNVGDIREVEYQDLLSWKVMRSHCLFDPMIVIEDDEIREEWDNDLGSIYAKVDSVDVDGMFRLSISVFKDRLSKLPNSVRETVQNTAYRMIQENRLYDIRYIKAIDEILGTELLMMI